MSLLDFCRVHDYVRDIQVKEVGNLYSVFASTAARSDVDHPHGKPDERRSPVIFPQTEVSMLSLRFAFSTLVFALLCLPAIGFGQAQDGTIEASWNRPSPTPAPRVQPAPSREQARSREQTAPSPRRGTADDAKYSEHAWDKQRHPSSRPWPALSARPTVQEYYTVNTAVIDSLAHLYCLSTNYIGSLRLRNEQALQSKEQPHARDFNYDGTPAAPRHGQQSLQALHKELMLLLERCLVGR